MRGPARHAVGFGAVTGAAFELQGVDLVADRDAAQDAVFDQLPGFVALPGLGEAHGGAADAVGADADVLDGADQLGRVVVAQQRAGGQQSGEVDGAVGVVEDFDTPEAFVWRFG